ncbi:hypothetical protein RhiirA1_473507 [Rhizophagus irregularis]|uniref:C2H2-type domain-containing protein n=1 Tax=Rhizophagus irregularis TaxID=588596 RepID=A0A2N0R0G2_9GLOM|nr:hypothetical protein RhiirA1_473507 [Rhizophagus irregularis]
MSLSEDCIREIIEYLSDDKRSLYSCLLTNRLFCRFVIPILWRNPWINIDLKCIDSKEKNYWNILGRTIIKCFLQEIKNSPFLLKKFNKDLLLLLQKQPLFNYVLYIQIISLDVINKLIKGIFGNIDDKKIIQKYQKKFWSFFMKRCSKIKYLDMPNFNIFEFSISKRSLLSLSILKINIITCPEEIILELSKNIHNLKRIEFCLDNIESENSIYHNSTISDLSDSDSEDISIMSEENSKYNDNISTLILSQKNLREIKFIYVRSMVNLFKKKTIEHLSNSLRILELCNCTYLPIQAITNFINLTELKICFHSFDYNEDDVNDNNFKGVYLSKLEILSLLNFREKDLIFVAKLIETTKDTLKILNIRPHTNNAIEVITNNTTYTIDTTLLSRNTSPSPLSIEYYLHAIKMVCSNIEVLPVWLGSTSLEEFEDLLKSCSKLKKIIIYATKSFNNILTKKILHLLAIKSSSPLLINIHLIGEWKFSNLELENFFNLWKEMRRKPLEFFSKNNIYYIYIKSNYIFKYSKQYKCKLCNDIFDKLEYSYFHLITTHFKKTPICCWNDCGSDHLFNFIQITSTFITNKKI